MRHTNDNILDSEIDRSINQGLHTWDKSFTTLQTETLVVGVLLREEVLERVRPDEAIEDASLFIDAVVVWLWDFDTLSDPVALVTVWDVDVFNTDGSAVNLFAVADDFSEGHLLLSVGSESWKDTGTEGVFSVQILFCESVMVEVQFAGV